MHEDQVRGAEEGDADGGELHEAENEGQDSRGQDEMRPVCSTHVGDDTKLVRLERP